MKYKWWLEKFKDGYKTQGFGELCRLVWEAITNVGQTRLILFALTHPRPLDKAREAAKSHVFKFASPEEMTELSKNPEYNIGEIDVERVRTGAIKCLLQLDNEDLAGYACIWGNQLPYIADGIHINLPDDTIYNFKGYTNPKYRGYGFQALRHLELLHILEGEGVKRLFGFVNHLNSKSLHGVRKSGYEYVGELFIKHKKNKGSAKIILEENFWCSTPRL